jgi:glycosyltransferase involved in cell wall biosynthesis
LQRLGGERTLQRIGLLTSATNSWAGGQRYMDMMARALGHACRNAGVELHLLDDSEPFANNADRPYADIITPPPGENSSIVARFGRLMGWNEKSSLLAAARAHQLSVVLPICREPFTASDVKSVAWIPDFQHRHLPELFSEGLRTYRDENYQLLAERCERVILSSRTALNDFVNFSPANAPKARIASFCSLLPFEPPSGDVFATQRRFRLPRKFALVANQFWIHKNHRIVVDALAKLVESAAEIHVVMAGVPADTRDPNNENLSAIFQAIASAGLSSRVILLGRVGDTDWVNLLRTAAVVIQPSRFEGWSTVLQDAKALGRPVICSDIPVHREQAPHALGFFDCDDSDALAAILAAHWGRLVPGPDQAVEERALAAELRCGRAFGDALLRVCQEAYSS